MSGPCVYAEVWSDTEVQTIEAQLAKEKIIKGPGMMPGFLVVGRD
jgi:hypothetical protein